MHLKMTKHIWNFIKNLPENSSNSVKKVLIQRFSELIFAQYVINLSISNPVDRKKETSDFTLYLKSEKILELPEILNISKMLILTNGRVIMPGVMLRNILQNKKAWRIVERSLLTALKKMKK